METECEQGQCHAIAIQNSVVYFCILHLYLIGLGDCDACHPRELYNVICPCVAYQSGCSVIVRIPMT